MNMNQFMPVDDIPKRQKVKRKKEHIDASISKRMDPEYIFSAKLKIAAGKVCAE